MRESRPVGTAAGATAAHVSIRSRVAVAGSASSNGLVSPTRQGPHGASGAAPPSTEQATDFLSASRRLRDLRNHYTRLNRQAIVKDLNKTLKNAGGRIENLLCHFGGDKNELGRRPPGTTRGELAYRKLLDMARPAKETGGLGMSDEVYKRLAAFDLGVDAELQALIATHGLHEASPSQPRPALPKTAPAAVATTAVAPATSLQADPTKDFDWIDAIRQLQQACDCFRRAGADGALGEVEAARDNVADCARHRFDTHGGKRWKLPELSPDVRSRPEQHYRGVEAMYRQARDSRDKVREGIIRRSLETLHGRTATALQKLTTKYGPLENLSIESAVPGQPPTMTDAATRAPASLLGRGPGNLPPAVPGGAGTPEESPFLSAMKSLLEKKSYHAGRGDPDTAREFRRAHDRVSKAVQRRYAKFGGNILKLEGDGRSGKPKEEQIYVILKEQARQAWEVDDQPTFENIRAILEDFDTRALKELHALTGETRPDSVSSARGEQQSPDSDSSIQAEQQPPAMAAPAATTPSIQAPASTPGPSNRGESYRQIRDLFSHFSLIGQDAAVADFRAAENRISDAVNRLFGTFCRDLEPSPVQEHHQASTAERQYRALEELSRQTIADGETWRHENLCQALQAINQQILMELQTLRNKYGALDALESSAEMAGQQPSAAIGSGVPGSAPPVPVSTDSEQVDWSGELLRETEDIAAANGAGSFLSAIEDCKVSAPGHDSGTNEV